jgi:Ion transport protein
MAKQCVGGDDDPTESSTASGPDRNGDEGDDRMETPAPAAALRPSSVSLHHHDTPSSPPRHRDRTSTMTTTTSQGSSSMTPFYLLQENAPISVSSPSPLHFVSRSRRRDFVAGGGNTHAAHDVDTCNVSGYYDEEQDEADSQAGTSTVDGDSSTTDGIHVYSLSNHPPHPHHRANKGAAGSASLPQAIPTTSVTYPSHPRSLPCCPCTANSCSCFGTSMMHLERWSGVVTNLHYKRLGLIAIAVCSLALGLRTTDTVQQSDAALAVVNQLIHGLLVVFTVQLALEVIHCAFQLSSMVPSLAALDPNGNSHQASPTARPLYSPETTTSSSTRPRPSRRKELEAAQHPIHRKKSRWMHLRVGFLLLDALVVALSWTCSDTILIVRTFWLLKGLRRAPGISELRLLIHALAVAAPTLSALAAMLLVVLYVFSVLFCGFFGALPYFDGLSATSWTLFQLLTLDNWSEIAMHTNETYPHSWILIVAYLGVAVIVGTSLLVAIMTLAVSNAYHERLRLSLLPDPSTRTTEDDLLLMNAGVSNDAARCGSERTATLTEPFLKGDSLTAMSHGTQSGATSRLLRLEQKMDEVTASVQQMARVQASMLEILQGLKVE